jgi:hypothetical protein
MYAIKSSVRISECIESFGPDAEKTEIPDIYKKNTIRGPDSKRAERSSE